MKFQHFYAEFPETVSWITFEMLLSQKTAFTQVGSRYQLEARKMRDTWKIYLFRKKLSKEVANMLNISKELEFSLLPQI